MNSPNRISILAPDGAELSVAAAGQGPTLMLLHGFPLDHRLWMHQIENLSANFHVIAPDLRGFGKSTSPAGFSIAQLAADCEFIRQKLAPDAPLVLGGLSMGGYVALEYWAQYSHRLSGLVLSHTKPQGDDEPVRAKRLEMADAVLQRGTWEAVAEMLPKLISPATAGSRPQVVELVRDMMRSQPPQTIAAAQHAMAQRRDFLDQLPRIDVPVLVITGQDDPLAPPDSTARWAEIIPRQQFHAIPTAGHLSPLETPREFEALLEPFLQSTVA